ncbi:MAG: hypothetical protein ACI91T_003222 [Natronomonas sp.]|jgi:hypothetical protein
MYGIVTRNEAELSWDAFDRGFYQVKDVTGRGAEPVADGVNMISCFGDNATVEANPELAAVSEDGERATRDQPYFDWDYVCPTREGYRQGLLDTVEEAVGASPDVRLDDVGFPRAEYCHCEVCDDRFEASAFDDRMAWRADEITEFVTEAADRIPGRTYFTLYPDPYPGHLYRRNGLDLDTIAEHVDEFVVTLYDTNYGTTYWLETIAAGFADLLDTPFSVELYAVDVDVDALVHAAEVVEAYADGVWFGYDAGTAQAAIRRMDAESREGKEFGAE